MPFANYICFALVVCIGGLWKAVECSVVHVHMHRRWVVAACNLIATDHGRHGRYGLVSNAECLVDMYLCIICGGTEKFGGVGGTCPPKVLCRGSVPRQNLTAAGAYKSYLTIHPLSMFCVTPPDLGCCSLHPLCCVSYSKTSEQRTLWGRAFCPL